MMRLVAVAILVMGAWLTASAQVELKISGGRVWLAATNATVGQILSEWARVGGTQIVNGDRVPGGPVTLELNNVSEQEALDLLLRTAAGFMAVRKAVPIGTSSGFGRILILTNFAPGVQPVFGRDGQPVPDDQQDAPPRPQPPFRSMPPGFSPIDPNAPQPPYSPEPAAEQADTRIPTPPVGAPRPGMVVPTPQTAPAKSRPNGR
jgi:hypothetical protein